VGDRARAALALALLAVMLAARLESDMAHPGVPDALIAVVIVAASIVALRRPLSTLPNRIRVPAVTTVLALVAVIGWVVTRHYEDGRYADSARLAPRYDSLSAAFTWARGIDGARIGFAGFEVHYPLYGMKSTNATEYVGTRGPHGTFSRIGSCPDWRRAVTRGHYEYLVLTPINYPESARRGTPPEVAWSAAPGSRVVYRDPERALWILKLAAPLRAADCASRRGLGTTLRGFQ
jgi:hypothetical protein